MDGQRVAEWRLIAECRPYLAAGDMDGMAAMLLERWSENCLVLLLASRDSEVILTAAKALGAVGRMSACSALVRLLRHDAAAVSASAEDALWSIWFRTGGRTAQTVLYRIAQSIRHGEAACVPATLSELIHAYPTYAEAHHQRSQAHYLTHAYEQALRDAARTLELNPWHFAAMAVQAHSLAALGRYQESLRAYRGVLQLHPRLPGIRESIQGIRGKLVLAGV